jgi:hypothetical protein
VFVVDDVEHGQRGGTRDGIPAEGAEEGSAAREPVGQVAAHDERRHGMSVPHRLAHRHDVRNDPGPGERPEPVAEPAVARLDLVGHEQPAGRLHRMCGRREELVGGTQHAFGGEREVDVPGGHRDVALRQRPHRLADALAGTGRPVRFLATRPTAVPVGRGEQLDVVRVMALRPLLG